MNEIRVDQRTIEILQQARELAELRDADGALVGILIPATARKARAWAEVYDHVDTIDLLHGKTAHSISYTFPQMWDSILTRVPPDAPDVEQVREMIARRRREDAEERLVDDDPPNPLDEAKGID
jgi:hypothetical protein